MGIKSSMLYPHSFKGALPFSKEKRDNWHQAFGTPDAPPPPPPPAPPETIDEGAYMARDRSRRRARLAGGSNSTQTGAGAAYSAAPKKLTGQ